jgi:hypothetical protein
VREADRWYVKRWKTLLHRFNLDKGQRPGPSRHQDPPTMTKGREGDPSRRDEPMAIIRATCQDCGDVEMTTADVWVRICDDDNSGTYAFRCPCCETVVIKPAESHIVDLLVASGVSWSTWTHPAELRERPDGEAFTYDDLIDFHSVLEADDWFERLSELIDDV